VAQVLRLLTDLRPEGDPHLLVGLGTPDDAAVYRLNDEQAIVLTTDFFAPLVDDPHDFGAISATNAMSDIYAMGGEVTLALNVAAFPEEMDPAIIAGILRGGAEKVHEAGGIVAGGHTIIDAEPKYGLCVMGLVHPDRLLTKAGAREGDAIFLTKPIGTGIVTTAAMRDEASPEDLSAAVESMTRLSRHAMHLARDAGVQTLTDVTGYSVLGHGYEVAAASGVELQIEASLVPVLPGALDYAARGILTGGATRNRAYLDGKVRIAPGVPEPTEHVLFDAQTSGGLLFTAAESAADEIERSFAASGEPLWRIGTVTRGDGVEVVG
jgi:selenide,water dikinase